MIAVWALYQGVLGLGGGVTALRRLGLALAVNGVAVATFAIIQSASWGGKIFWLRTSPMGPSAAWSTGGPFVGHGPLAAYLNLGLGFAMAALFVKSSRRNVRVWAAYAAGVIAAGVVASHSRSGILAAAGAGVWLLVVTRSKSRQMAVGMAAMLAFAGVMVSTVSESSPLQRILSIADSASYEARMEIGRVALATWLEYPIFGAGLGTFATSSASHFGHDFGSFFTRAENEYLDILVEGGLLGLGLALAGLANLARRGSRAIGSMVRSRDRAMAIAGCFGLLALVLHSLGDFAVHIPGVAIPATILAARLVGLRSRTPVPGSRKRAVAAWCAVILAAVAGLPSSWQSAQAESLLRGAGIPLPGNSMPTAIIEVAPVPVLQRRVLALEGALRYCPDWAEGHLRLGLTQLALYRAESVSELQRAGVSPEGAQDASDPLRLLSAAESGDVEDLFAFEPIPRRLVPATHSFLEARRCAPRLAIPHAWLAALDILIPGGEGTSVHATRALRLAGGDGTVLTTAAAASHRRGDDQLAARLWRRTLEVAPRNWASVADEAGAVLPPEVILRDVLPNSGRLTLLVADRLYNGPEDSEIREQFLKAAIKRLPGDDLDEADRLALAARIHAGLGQRKDACGELQRALILKPDQSAWRHQLVAWLVEDGDYSASRRQAHLGLSLNPADGVLRQAVDVITEVSAYGPHRSRPASPEKPKGASLLQTGEG